jgi:RimJ/RimL family protein N-acetyltransferase
MMTHSDRPLGAEVAPGRAGHPDRRTLTGRFVTLEPLRPDHADDLFAVVGGEENAWAWDYMPDGPFDALPDFRDHIARKAASDDPLFFAIVDAKSGKAIGHATLMRIDPANRVIETGNIMFSPAMQRTPGATESMYLLARLVFDDLGYRRYEWKCNALNAPSRRAAERLGFTFEGVFRQHMVVKGRNRDTAWFSMLDSEWPAAKAAFETWLSPDNFDTEGRQRHALAALRKTQGD